MSTARQATAVAIGNQAILIEGEPGSGKSSLALSLIDRGAVLVGDDSVLLEASNGGLLVRPHPNTRGLIEVRNIGLVPMPVCEVAKVSLILRLDAQAPRFIDDAQRADICGIPIPLVLLAPHAANMAITAELALSRYGKDTG